MGERWIGRRTPGTSSASSFWRLQFSPSTRSPRGFGLDSLIATGAGTVVIWELSGAGCRPSIAAIRMIALVPLAIYLTVRSAVVLAAGSGPNAPRDRLDRSHRHGDVRSRRWEDPYRSGLGNPVLQAEGHVTLINGLLATGVLLGVTLNAVVGWWWADPAAALVIV